jgi:hypothetical protein
MFIYDKLLRLFLLLLLSVDFFFLIPLQKKKNANSGRFRNAKKPSVINFIRFFLDGLKPSSI